jgi:hypothetical protein
MDVLTPIREETIPAAKWFLKAAIDLAVRSAYQWWWRAVDLRLELNIGQVSELERIIRGYEYLINGHGPMRIMTMAGVADILWTWPDVNSVSILDAGRDGRRIIVRKEMT